MRKRPWVVLLVLSSCGIALAFAYAFASYGGYCISERRFLSDQEFFEAAVTRIIERPTAQLVLSKPSSTTFKSVNVIKYENPESFHEKNPDCCRVVGHNIGDEGPYTSFSQRVFGYAAKIVSITYQIKYIDESGAEKSVSKTEQFAVTNCGRAWNASH